MIGRPFPRGVRALFGAVLVLGLALGTVVVPAGPARAAGTSEWNGTPGVFEVDRLPASASTVPDVNAAAALHGERGENTRFRRSLNGDWRFHWSPNPNERPAGFHDPDFDVQDWATIPVPSNWQVQGYGEIIYLNQEHPWQGHGRISPPEVPVEHNEVGSYRRQFTVPGDWVHDRRTVLSFGGVKSAFYVWVNGERVGYSEDSFTPAEFDITDALRPGRNTLAVEVYRWSDGAWLENQDMLDLSGIFRDVEVYSTPTTYLHDHTVRTDLDDDDTGATLRVSAEVRDATRGDAPVAERLEAALYDAGGRPVFDRPLRTKLSFSDGTATAELARRVDRPALWSAEDPNLYTLVYRLRDARGKVVETTSTRVGFREFESSGEQLLLNGRSLDIKGVNRHEMHPDTGQALTREQMAEDIKLMKRHNINAVRVAHYPAAPEFYELADELGLYVLDEANLETHDMRPFPGDSPDWYDAVFDRVRSMVERDKNHPSVLMWSMGNEVGSGPVFADMAEWLRRTDPTRLLHFQQDNDLADVEGRFYPGIEELERAGRRPGKPYLMSEYAHGMGNSVGNIAEYWEVIDSSERLRGGFLWDWADQSISLPVDGGVDGLPVSGDEPTYFSYGGDWGDYRSDGSFHLNGLVNPDRRPHPELTDVKAAYANVDVAGTDLENGRIKLRNEFLFTSLDAFDVSWALHADDKRLGQGELNLDIGPGREQWVKLPVQAPAEREPGTEYRITLTVTQPEKTSWAPAGHEIATVQSTMPWSAPAEPDLRHEKGPALDVTDGDGTVRVDGADFRVVFDKAAGTISSFTSDGQELLTGSPKPNFWRPATQNDVQRGTVEQAEGWRGAPDSMVVDDVTVREVGDRAVHVQVEATLPAADNSRYRVGYFVFGSGDVSVRSTVAPGASAADLQAFGMRMSLPPELDNLTFYGRGPGENQSDRHNGSTLGVWETDVAEEFFPRVVPQETGNHTGVRWASLTDDSGQGLLVAGERPLEVTALHYTQEELERARHPHELRPTEDVQLTVNHKQAGVGNSWSEPALPQYRLDGGKPWSYQYRLRPVTADDDRTRLANRDLDLNLLSDIRVDGESLADFHTDVTRYSRTYSSAVEHPTSVVEAVPAHDGVHVEVTQAQDLPGTATVTATSADGLVSTTYRIAFETVSSLPVSDLDWESATVGWGVPGRDATVTGERIQLLGPDGDVMTYGKGIGVHADAEIVYDVSAWDFDRFRADVGVEQHADSAGRWFVFEVWLDGERAWSSPRMEKRTPAVPVDLDISGADELSLVMRQDGDGIGHGHGAWGDARLGFAGNP